MKYGLLIFLIWGGIAWNFEIQAQKSSSLNQVVITEGKVSYEIPYAYELMHVAIALTDTSYRIEGYSVYNELVDTTRSYYQEVMRYFKPFQNHALVLALNKELKKNPSRYGSNLKLAYNSSLGENFIKKNNQMPWVRRQEFLIGCVPRSLLLDFARVSNFEEFYSKHRTYYLDVLQSARKFARVHEQQVWLENHFPTQYGRYKLILSPLMQGTHFTQRFNWKHEKQCLMWIASPDETSMESLEIQSGRYMSIVMTEIDHNYVNPQSDLYKKRINSLLGEEFRKNWVVSTYASQNYGSGYKVFNEYMTHAVYLLFTSTLFPSEIQELLEKSKIHGMEKNRGFYRFGEFYAKCRSLTQNSLKKEPISTHYPELLNWIADINHRGSTK